MTPSRRQRLRALLTGPPSRDSFRAALALFAEWPAGDERDDALREAEAGLSRWPAEDRREDVSSRWLFGDPSAVQPWARLLRALDVRRVDQLAHRFTQLMRSPDLAGLEILEIIDSDIDLGALAASPHVRRLARLRLVKQALTFRERAAVASSGNFAALSALELVETRHADPFLDAVAPGRLGTLVLQGSLSSRGGSLSSLLAREPLLEGLIRLDLSSNNLRDADALALAKAARLDHLRVLDLRRNEGITPAGQEAVRTAPHLRRTTVLFGR